MTKGYESARMEMVSGVQAVCAERLVDELQKQREAHNAYCKALEERIAALVKDNEKIHAAHMLAYSFLLTQPREVVDEYVKACLNPDEEDYIVGIPLALEGLDDKSDLAAKWSYARETAGYEE